MIEHFGWGPALQDAFLRAHHSGQTRALAPGRVVAQHRDLWQVVTHGGDRACRLSGRFARDAGDGDYPVVGDWVGVDEAGGLIHLRLPRSSAFVRRAAGGHGVQTICANIDVALIVMSLNGDLNARRLERYLAAVADGGARAVCVLTKADLAADAAAAAALLADSLQQTPIVVVSALTGAGLDALQPWLRPGETVVLLGSSGAGKSTLLNVLMGEAAMATRAIREHDDRGRHTTRHRALFRLPNAALLIDTPGLRELGLTIADDALDAGFSEITALFSACRYRNCSHDCEPECAVQAALTEGRVSEDRWRAYQKLQRDVAFERRRSDPAAAAEEREKWKRIHKHQAAKTRFRQRNAGWTDDG